MSITVCFVLIRISIATGLLSGDDDSLFVQLLLHPEKVSAPSSHVTQCLTLDLLHRVLICNSIVPAQNDSDGKDESHRSTGG
jgi:hypothetical protein